MSKVFVGNLDFSTTDQALQEAFAQCGPVKSGVVITRGRRPLGYGFVEFGSPEVALSAVERMNKVILSGRQIKVEIAKDFLSMYVNTEPGAGYETGPAPRRRREARADDLVREDEKPTPNPVPTGVPPNPGEAPPQRKHRRRRNPKRVRQVTEKIPSKTTLFVANLPFSIDDEKLKSIFADTNVKAAHVVRTLNGRSRGYGFVEFENEKDQITAMQSKNNVEVEGANGTRKISVSISNSVAPEELAAKTNLAPSPPPPANVEATQPVSTAYAGVTQTTTSPSTGARYQKS